MATPHVAGVAALLYAQGAESPDEVEKALFAGAKQVGLVTEPLPQPAPRPG